MEYLIGAFAAWFLFGRKTAPVPAARVPSAVAAPSPTELPPAGSIAAQQIVRNVTTLPVPEYLGGIVTMPATLLPDDYAGGLRPAFPITRLRPSAGDPISAD